LGQGFADSCGVARVDGSVPYGAGFGDCGVLDGRGLVYGLLAGGLCGAGLLQRHGGVVVRDQRQGVLVRGHGGSPSAQALALAL